MAELSSSSSEVASGTGGTKRHHPTVLLDCHSYHVQVIETEASIRCGLRPITVYNLTVAPNQLSLEESHKTLFVWPLKHVRRYGYTSNSFSFEAGSKCQTGEGLFIFRNHKSKVLYNQINHNIDRIKTLHSPNLLKHRGPLEEKDSTRTVGIERQVPHLVLNDCAYAQVVKK